MTCTVVSPLDTKAFNKLQSIVLPAKKGTLEVRPGHAELMTTVSSGLIKLRYEDGTTTDIMVSDAICWIASEEVRIIL